MADGVTVRLEGGEELLRKLRRMEISVSQVLEAAMQEAAEVVRKDAAGLAPGPEVEKRTMERKLDHVTVAVGADKKHWYYQFFELGASGHTILGNPKLAWPGDDGKVVVVPQVSHPGMAARPFLRPAHDANHDTARDAAGAKLLQAILAETD